MLSSRFEMVQYSDLTLLWYEPESLSYGITERRNRLSIKS